MGETENKTSCFFSYIYHPASLLYHPSTFIAQRERERERERMDQTEYHSLESSTHQFLSSQFPKKITQLLLSVSLFSLLFSYTSWFSFFLQSLLKLNSFSEFFSQLLSHNMDKNCIFLICNGILVFLAKTSGLIRFSPQLPDLNNHHSEFKKIVDEDGLQSVSDTESLVEKEVPKETTEPQENVVEEEEEEKEELNTQGEEGAGIPQDEENGRELGNIVFLHKEDDEEEEEENEENEANGLLSMEELNKEDEGNGLLSTEELNKKCDEFIRRMKKEIMIGAQ